MNTSEWRPRLISYAKAGLSIRKSGGAGSFHCPRNALSRHNFQKLFRIESRERSRQSVNARDRHFDHRYAVTSHSSQGLTAERVLVNMIRRCIRISSMRDLPTFQYREDLMKHISSRTMQMNWASA